MKINTNSEKIKSLLERNVVEIISKESLEAKLLSGKKLRVKLGIDPTSPNIHIGRAAALWKLRAFQELGHKVVFIVGDFTGLVGDTSDKDSERPMLSEKQVRANLGNYFKQAFKILDKRQTETHYNSEWLKKLGFKEIAALADLFGLHEFESREVISRRLKEGKRVSLREVLYPLMQGYDSVAVKSDVELGGTDQRFNLLAGRTVQIKYGQGPQDILMTGLLEGTDGRKMSSSLGNVINIADEPREMFGKVMSVRDESVGNYFKMATRLSDTQIAKILSKKPIDQKERLAFEIVQLYHGEKSAAGAQRFFKETFQEKKLPEDIPEYKFEKGALLQDILKKAGLVGSGSEFRRLVRSGAIEVNEEIIKNPNHPLSGEVTVKAGKKRFVKLLPK